MALKYFFEFEDVESILHRVEIYNDDFVGDATEVKGSCQLTKASTTDTLESIRGGGLKIDLEATTELDFTDLYSEEERTFSVKYFRDSQILFNGFISPEGLFQSFTEDIWTISLDCIDGLGFLKNLSYVDNVTKEQFVGKQSMLEVIVNCLKRTGIEQEIYTNVEIWYEGLTTTNDVLANAKINSFRYIKTDNQTTMQCDEVLRTILELLSASITQWNGKWLIYKPNYLYLNENIDFFRYDSDGVALSPSKETLNFRQVLGSDINGFYPHHVNRNQQISIDNSIGAYRISYKYGLTNSFFNNVYLENVAGVIDEWTIDDATYLDFPADDRGFILTGRDSGTESKILTSQSVSFIAGNTLSYQETLKRVSPDVLSDGISVTIVKLVGGSGTRYLSKQGLWQAGLNVLSFDLQFDQEFNFTINSEPLPFDGDVFIELWTPINNTPSLPAGLECKYLITKSFIAPATDLGVVKGEVHTFQKTLKPSSKIGETKEVFNGDSPSELYVGTIYKADGITPTENWNLLDYSPLNLTKPILYIMGIERMLMYARPLKVFKGDVYGFIDFLSVVSIDNIDGLFMPIEYSYDALRNITTLKMKEILSNPELIGNFSDIEYNFQINNENEVVEPTINN